MAREAEKIDREAKADAGFIETAVDFFRTYADRCHHGKEEDILFAELKKKKLLAEDRRILEELLAEHVFARNVVAKLLKAKVDYVNSCQEALKEIKARLNDLIELYPAHIEKEDKHFFIPVMKYFSENEQATMLQKMDEFDKKLIHEKYKRIVEGLKQSHG